MIALRSIHLLKTLTIVAALAGPAVAQQHSDSAAVQKSLAGLTHFGSVLMIAAHPDDENTAILAYLAKGRGFRTAYLSLTRGEGGQNLIGSEKGSLLGVIRTEELLAARGIDGAGQYFTRAIDFGFSKTPEETIAKWGREEVVSDIVWIIRKFRPDVVIMQWTGTPRDGHGHHQASAILGREALALAGDPSKFPDQLTKGVTVWKPKYVMETLRVGGFGPARASTPAPPDAIPMHVGGYDPVLGASYSEIAGVSRSMHHSQGQGTPQLRGEGIMYVHNLGPEKGLKDLFDGIDVSWARVTGGEPVGKLLEQAVREYRPDNPTAILPLLKDARAKLSKLIGSDAERKLRDLDETIAMVAGLWVDVAMASPTGVPGGSVERRLTVLNRSHVDMQLVGIGGSPTAASSLPFNTPVTQTTKIDMPPSAAPSQPYWLRDAPVGSLYTVQDQRLRGIPEELPENQLSVTVRVEGTDITLVRPVWNRYVDEVRGELTRPFVVQPAVSLRIPQDPVLFLSSAVKAVDVEVMANADAQSGTVSLVVPKGWRAEPVSEKYTIAKAGEMASIRFHVTPGGIEEQAQLRAVARTSGGGEITLAKTVIDYPHIPRQTVFETAGSNGVRTDVRVAAQRVGYIMGAGDEVPDALRQMGCDVTLLGPEELSQGDLGRFDAIVTGVRAYNTRADLLANQHRLLDYVNNGGTLVVQYNTFPAARGVQGPFPFALSRDRVTVEDAPVTMVAADHPILHRPNEITAKDFAGWVQERGLYFASTWDPKYTALFEMSDPGEKPTRGSTLIAPYGKGVYVFTALSFFRQLPAGVPGAYRLFANLVSASKTLH